MPPNRLSSTCTPKQFGDWRRAMNWSRAKTAKNLGIGTSTVFMYESGVREKGKKTVVPRVVALAMAALSANLKPVGS